MIAGAGGAIPTAVEIAITASRLASDLRALGVRGGAPLLVHTSLSAVAGPDGLVLGGAQAVIEALLAAVGSGGTIVMPAHSSSWSEPSAWRNPPVDESLWPSIREHWPAFRPDLTPTLGVGVVPEVFRAMDGVVRGDHPQTSFAAWGTDAASLVLPHPLEQALGDGGPLGRLYDRDAWVLLLGAPWESCTCFHLAQTRVRPPLPSVRQGAAVVRDGGRRWVTWLEPDIDWGDFEALGESYERTGAVREGPVGAASSRLFRLRGAVDHAVPWLEARRSGG